jgi:hypothetical protein
MISFNIKFVHHSQSIHPWPHRAFGSEGSYYQKDSIDEGKWHRCGNMVAWMGKDGMDEEGGCISIGGGHGQVSWHINQNIKMF